MAVELPPRCDEPPKDEAPPRAEVAPLVSPPLVGVVLSFAVPPVCDAPPVAELPADVTEVPAFPPVAETSSRFVSLLHAMDATEMLAGTRTERAKRKHDVGWHM
jgi:hypothetical protein